MNEYHNLKREIQAAKALLDQVDAIMSDSEDDFELQRDMVEGETDLHEAIAEAALAIMEARNHEAALKEMIDNLTKRKQRYQQRQELLRTAILNAMQVGDIRDKMELPFATISRGNKPRALQITDEAAIPSDFWQPRPPALDKKAVTEALKKGEPVIGAELDNGGERLILRWS